MTTTEKAETFGADPNAELTEEDWTGECDPEVEALFEDEPTDEELAEQVAARLGW